MIAPNAGLSVNRQCTLLGIVRSSYYYQPRPPLAEELDLLGVELWVPRFDQDIELEAEAPSGAAQGPLAGPATSREELSQGVCRPSVALLTATRTCFSACSIGSPGVRAAVRSAVV